MVQIAAVHATVRKRRKNSKSRENDAESRKQSKKAERQRKALIQKYDVSKTGQLSKEELKKLLIEDSKTEVSDQDVDYYFKRFDRSESGGITQEEIEALLASFHDYLRTKPEAEEFMKKYDVSKDGCLDKEELKQLMIDMNGGGPVDDAEVDEVMQAADMLKHEKIEMQDLLYALAIWDSSLDQRSSGSCCVLL
mmetsp:Transcript_126151/g.251980  ORF Transcript_126151/g.251980 Transcript_126151/m.251980 type:complete len:194 (+) Transcript_126151:52-633(+)